ncbi:MAG: UDP-N-acetylenolpyruvoylglucosamine reductase, partial [Clostridia bacterium]|nr:UDP-N-acetylenolpyruvoylglucosamine reductase [Clostridia bacterium]
GLAGLECLAGMPASVGGVAFRNAGAFGVTAFDVIDSVVIISGGKKIIRKSGDFAHFYRNGGFAEGETVTGVYFSVTESDTLNVRRRVGEILDERQKFPKGKSCGSVFKNPDGDFAGRLIEGCNLKGLTLGGAKISDVHANLIINEKDASAYDVYRLIKTTQAEVESVFSVRLREEVVFLGDF